MLPYFAQRQDNLFIVITAPPLRSEDTSPEAAANARAFNNWLMNDWLDDYPYINVAVFDFYNVLTSNGGSTRIDDPDTSDAGRSDGNHHRWWDGSVQHIQTIDNNYSAYWTDDSHPSQAGNQKATAEFVPLLNYWYGRWQAGPTQKNRFPHDAVTRQHCDLHRCHSLARRAAHRHGLHDRRAAIRPGLRFRHAHCHVRHSERRRSQHPALERHTLANRRCHRDLRRHRDGPDAPDDHQYGGHCCPRLSDHHAHGKHPRQLAFCVSTARATELTREGCK